jgi:hypothetical protein
MHPTSPRPTTSTFQPQSSLGLAILLATLVACTTSTPDDPVVASPAPSTSPSGTGTTPDPGAPLTADVTKAGIDWTEGLPTTDVTLEAPAPVTIAANGTGSVHVRIVRKNYRGSVKLSVVGLPADVTAKTVWIAPTANEADIPIKASCPLFESTPTVKLDATGGGFQIHTEATFALAIGDVSHRLGNLDTRLAGRGYTHLAQGGWPGPLVRTTGDRFYVLSTSCDLGRYDIQDVTPDATFGTGGVVHLGSLGTFCGGLVRSANGTIFAVAIEGEQLHLSRISEAGVIDPAFDVKVPYSYELAFDPQGRTLLVAEDGTITRRGTDGTIDPSFTATPLPRPSSKVAALASGGAIVGPESYLFGTETRYRLVVSNLGEWGGVAGEVPLKHLVGPVTEPETPLWTIALPSGDVLAAVTGSDGAGGTTTALVRLQGSPTGQWDATSIATASSFGPPSVDTDGTVYFSATTVQRRGPDLTWIYSVDPTFTTVKRESFGTDIVRPWSAVGALLPIGSNSALLPAVDPKDSNKPVISRVWVR